MKKKLVSIVLLSLILAMFGTVNAQVPATERVALVELYSSTNGDSWTNNSGWKEVPLDTDGFAMPGTERTWNGVTCEGGNVVRIDLHSNNLVGTIPPELGDLTNLTYLALSYNQLSGEIPSALSNLTDLERLYLNNNQLAGSIPDWLGNLTSLVRLELGSNQLTGAIPVDLGDLTNLTHLTLHSNQLYGDIPPELGGLTKLEHLNLYGNQLKGPVPEEITNLNSLKNDCDFRYNALYTSEDAVRIFLNDKQRDGDWESTQTIAPNDLVAGELTGNSIPLTWTAIAYTGDTGGYEIYYADTPGGPFMLFETTADKTVDNTTVTGLTPGTYYFRLRTVTDSHARNQNIVYSEYTEMVIGGVPIIEETIDFFDEAVEDGTITGSAGWIWGQIQLNIMRQHLTRASFFIERGYIGAACWRLRRAYLGCDGVGYDWVVGEDADNLAQMIYDLAVSLDCWWTGN